MMVWRTSNGAQTHGMCLAQDKDRYATWVFDKVNRKEEKSVALLFCCYCCAFAQRQRASTGSEPKRVHMNRGTPITHIGGLPVASLPEYPRPPFLASDHLNLIERKWQKLSKLQLRWRKRRRIAGLLLDGTKNVSSLGWDRKK